MITITGNQGGTTFNVAADELTEGAETATFTLFTYDSNGNGTGELSATVSISDTSVTPDPEYTLTFNANGGSGTTPNLTGTLPITIQTSSQFRSRSGYNYGGVNTALNGSGSTYQEGDEYNLPANDILHAQWSPIVPFVSASPSYSFIVAGQSATITATAGQFQGTPGFTFVMDSNDVDANKFVITSLTANSVSVEYLGPGGGNSCNMIITATGTNLQGSLQSVTTTVALTGQAF